MLPQLWVLLEFLRRAHGAAKALPNAASKITKVIGVVSGKGGVGKTLVTCLLASELQKAGKRVGIMDADVTGPSIPKAFGVKGPLSADTNGLNPGETESGIKMISTNLMLPQEDMAVAWRGPVVSGIISQFFNEVNWGELDYLLIDMPPGTSDVLLTVFQQIPLDGIVTVSAPQELVAMMRGQSRQSRSRHEGGCSCPGGEHGLLRMQRLRQKHYIFGEPQGADVAKRYDIPSYATLPMDPAIATLVDAGEAGATTSKTPSSQFLTYCRPFSPSFTQANALLSSEAKRAFCCRDAAMRQDFRFVGFEKLRRFEAPEERRLTYSRNLHSGIQDLSCKQGEQYAGAKKVQAAAPFPHPI
ncbi:MAG: P-loop NTPase [Slackia sp.]